MVILALKLAALQLFKYLAAGQYDTKESFFESLGIEKLIWNSGIIVWILVSRQHNISHQYTYFFQASPFLILGCINSLTKMTLESFWYCFSLPILTSNFKLLISNSDYFLKTIYVLLLQRHSIQLSNTYGDIFRQKWVVINKHNKVKLLKTFVFEVL